jgi:protein SCO1/2
MATDMTKPAMLEGVDVVEHLGDTIPLDTVLTDSFGRMRPLRSLVSGQRPVLLTLVYYRCPMLCNVLLGGVVRGLRETGWQLGREYDAITISFDPEDRPLDAAGKQRGYLQALGAPEWKWPFLVGDARPIADAVGLKVKRDPSTGQFAHVAVAFVLTPQGKLSRYLYGIEFPARELKLALGEASGGKIGSTFERFLLHCYRWDPATRRYGLFVQRYFRLGGIAIFILLALWLGRHWRRERAA